MGAYPRPRGRRRDPAPPRVIVGVDGPDARENDSSSFYNLTEVDRVVSLVESLLRELGPTGLKAAEVSVISPFRTQVKKLRLLLRNHNLSNVGGAFFLGTRAQWRVQHA